MKFTIEKKGQHYEFEADEGEKLLYAGLRAGISLPYECATGTCGTCRARLKSGEIDEGWVDAPGKTGLKAEKQEFLLCQACAAPQPGSDSNASESGQIGIPALIRPFRGDDISPSYHAGSATNWQPLTNDVLQFDVVLSEPVQFHAGQFYVLKTPGIEGYRAYSMVNYAAETNVLTFIVKNKPGGSFSSWAFDGSRDGSDRIEVFGPLGRATFHPDEDADLFMIAGGSGIAGIMSILRRGAQCGHFASRKATVYFGVRTVDDAFYVTELNALQKQFPDNIEVNIVFSDQSSIAEGSAPIGGLSPGFGFVHEQALAAIPPGLTNTIFYLAGPPPMVDALIRPLIIDVKLPADKIRYDKFG